MSSQRLLDGFAPGRLFGAASVNLPLRQKPYEIASYRRRARLLIIAYTDYAFDARVKRHAEALAEHGYAVDVVCLGSELQELNSVRLIGIPVSRYRGYSRLHYIAKYARFFTLATMTAAKLNRASRYDVVIACSIPDFAVVTGLVPKLFGSSLILDIHDTMPELYREKFPGPIGAIGAAMLRVEERTSAWLTDRVFAVHEPHAKRLHQAGIPSNKTTVILNTPDSRLFNRDKYCESPSPDHFTLVTHGTINRRLGLDTALDAIKLLQNRIPSMKLRIIGPGEHRASLQQRVHRLQLNSVVSFEDGVPLEHLSETLRSASIGLVPNEATPATHLMLPVKLLEYVALGVPVVASRLRTVLHYFPQDALAYFDPGNANSLAQAIMATYSDPLKRRRLVERATEAAAPLRWEVQRERLFAAVDGLLDKQLALAQG